MTSHDFPPVFCGRAGGGRRTFWALGRCRGVVLVLRPAAGHHVLALRPRQMRPVKVAFCWYNWCFQRIYYNYGMVIWEIYLLQYYQWKFFMKYIYCNSREVLSHDGSMVLLYMVCHGSHQYIPFMLAYIPAPWILWVYEIYLLQLWYGNWYMNHW